MNVLDENVVDSQTRALRDRRTAFRQIGVELGSKGMSDREVVALLHALGRPTFFTRDDDFYDRRLCHVKYCLVFLDVGDDEAAEYVVRTLRHPELNTWAKRRGAVIRASTAGLHLWRLHGERQLRLRW